MHIPDKIKAVAPPGIHEISERARALRASGIHLADFGQGIPDYNPPPMALEAASQALSQRETHVYSPDPGLWPLREALAQHLFDYTKIELDPASELLITAGANQAFMLAALTLLNPGDKALLPSPYYFNHEMTIRIAGGIPVEVPLSAANGFQLTVKDLEPYLAHSPRILVLVTPNNPTGAVYDAHALQHISQWARANDITIVTDETYSHMVYEGEQLFSLASLPNWRPHIVTLGSFSKTYGMTGWRLGFVIANPEFISETLKVQDSMLICAPVISRKVGLAALNSPYADVQSHNHTLNERRICLMQHVSQIDRLRWHPTRGAFYAFVQVRDCQDSFQLALDLLEQAHVISIPGSVFGQAWHDHLRLSYGAVDTPTIHDACERIAAYFAQQNR